MIDGTRANGVVINLIVVGGVHKHFECVRGIRRQVCLGNEVVEGGISQIQRFVDGVSENNWRVGALTYYKTNRNSQDGRKSVVSNLDPHHFLVGVRTETILRFVECQDLHFHWVWLVNLEVID